MTGFKNFILRGNLVELAVALIMAPRSPPSSATVGMLMDLIGKAGGTPDFSSTTGRRSPRRVPQRGGLVRDPRRGRLLLRRGALHQGQGEVLPERRAGHARRTSTCSRRSATCWPPERRADVTRPARPPQPWWGGTCARSHASPASTRRCRRRRDPARRWWCRAARRRRPRPAAARRSQRSRRLVAALGGSCAEPRRCFGPLPGASVDRSGGLGSCPDPGTPTRR